MNVIVVILLLNLLYSPTFLRGGWMCFLSSSSSSSLHLLNLLYVSE
jgi:hypothetical protein